MIVLLVAFGGWHVSHYRTHFLPGTKIAGVALGGQTVAAADKTLTQHFKTKTYSLVENKKTLAQFSGQKIGVEHHFTAELKQQMKQQKAWQLTGHVQAATTKDAVQFNQAALKQYCANLAAKLNVNRTKPRNATLVKKNNSYVTVKGQKGNTISPATLKTLIVAAVSQDKGKIAAKQAYAEPSVTTSSKSLTDAKQLLKDIQNEDAKYSIAGSTVTIPKADLYDWTTYTNDQVQLDQSKVKAYVAALGAKYSTYKRKMSFNSTKQGTVSVKAKTYGWSIKEGAETKGLTAEILKGKSFTRTPITEGVGYNNGEGIGNTYVEVDKKNQHEWYYKDGKLVMDSDVVTGKPGEDTPSGVFFIWNKQRNATLTGKNDDGSDYSSAVSYWMPIDYTGVGLHDSPWQPEYGGTWYKEHGSHGCVNNPPSFIAKLYPAVALDTPVVII
ncbi:ErfK YbiS YcfS YnhG family protein [Lactobacillus selangorensis]|uniref:ErfK YbiS YcfS YnhG family protein n=1 Tax=Lactobacillus selangorensis TaxID=81857 RepID=A0A0R2FNE5_9LACO|nr:ErfK YbiS YcfS YnhG family protein [Lactobacillus selangorensis]KRN30652.1 ErfK YbiS YcfS YnhG family protein [Lactobacillus selangorensis]